MKRTPFKAKAASEGLGPARTSIKVSHGKCKAPGCGKPFTRFDMRTRWCSPECGMVIAYAALAKAVGKAATEDKRQTKAQLEALKTVPQLKKEAQREFNRFIRERDRLAGHPCISSGKPLKWGTTGITGSSVDAGHYRSTGAADHLRFCEDNCHAQSVQENRDKAGNAVAYRIGLIRRIGLARVEALECNNTPVKWTRNGLREIRDTYRAKANALAKVVRELEPA